MYARTAGATSPFPSQGPLAMIHLQPDAPSRPSAPSPAAAPDDGQSTRTAPDRFARKKFLPNNGQSKPSPKPEAAPPNPRPYALYSPRSLMYAWTAAGTSSPRSAPFRAHSRSAVALTST